MSIHTEHDLWSLALGGSAIDASELAAAVERQMNAGDALDFRTRLLIRDSLEALERHWGRTRLEEWLDRSPRRSALAEIRGSKLGPTGFASLAHRIMESTQPDTVMQFLRELGSRLPDRTRIEIGGSIALILAGVLSRHTEDLDVVDGVPAAISSQYELMEELSRRYGLHVTHFQSHYLPTGWKDRLRRLGVLGELEVLLVDAVDVFVGKLFSAREKDRDDLRAMGGHLDKKEIADRTRQFGAVLLAEARLANFAADNWFIIYGEPLPR